MTRPFRVVIVGAGVAGSILARTFERLPNVELTCIERVSRDDHSEAGTGLNVGPNAVKALTAHDAALAGAIDAAGLPWRTWRLSLSSGRELFHMPLSEIADCPGWRIRWSELYRVLRENCRSVRYGCTIEACGPDPADPSRSFVVWREGANTQRLDGIDLLIAADGRYSSTRQAFLGTPAVQHIGVAIFRLLVPDTSAGLINDYEQWFEGPHRLLAFRVLPDHIYIAGSLPITPGEDVPADARTADALARAYVPAKGPAGAQVAWMVGQIRAYHADIHWARMQEADVAFHAPGHGVLFVGDAAHAMVPTLGQGATQAIEDACVIGACLAEAFDRRAHDLPELLARIAAERAQRLRFVMQFSLDASDTMLPGHDPVAGSLLKTEPAFRAKLARLYRDIPAITIAPAMTG